MRDYTKTQFTLAKSYEGLLGYSVLPFPAGTNLGNYVPRVPLLDAVGVLSGQYRKTNLGRNILVSVGFSGINENAFFTLPVEVVVSVTAKNRVIKRYTHHPTGKGSIKEQWGQDDYTINIRGLLYDDSEESGEVIKRLDEFTAEGLVKVACPLLELFNINYMFIESFNPVFEKVESALAFQISGISDFRQDELLTELR